jgi:ribosomal protein S18 acetylase RimI-like enzyme
METPHLNKESFISFKLQTANLEYCELMFRLQKLDGAEIDPENADQIAIFEKYKNEFAPSDIQVIYFGGNPVGRLRLVRGEDLYVGGLQILPEYRGKGIGTAILEVLIQESEETHKTIRLEVFHDNVSALNLYEMLGFKVVDSNVTQKIMHYQPQTRP